MRWLALPLGTLLMMASGPAFAQRMYASRGPKGISYLIGSIGHYDGLLDALQQEESTPWHTMEVPWTIREKSEDGIEDSKKATPRPTVITCTINLQVRPSFGLEDLISLREWSDGHVDVEVVRPRYQSFWSQLNDPQIDSGTRNLHDLVNRVLWARKNYSEKEIPGTKAWVRSFRELRGRFADPVPSTMVMDGIGYRLSARGGRGFGAGWSLSWTAYNPDEKAPAVVWLNRVYEGVCKVMDKDKDFQKALTRLDDLEPGWAGYQGLRIAMEKGDLKTVQLLLAKGVDPNGPPHTLRIFPLSISPEILDAVLKAGGRVDIKEAPSQETALHVLLASNSTSPEPEAPILPLLDKLLEAGADPNARDFDNLTPLILAGGRAWPKAIKGLLDRGAKAEAKDVIGRTALHELCASHEEGERPGEVESAALLIARGCPVDARDDQGRTALALALKNDRPALWTWLLEHGADPLVRGKDGGTLLHGLVEGRYAFLYDDKPQGRARLALMRKALDALLAKGLSINATDNQGRTPLMVVGEESNAPLAHLLIQRGAKPVAKARPLSD